MTLPQQLEAIVEEMERANRERDSRPLVDGLYGPRTKLAVRTFMWTEDELRARILELESEVAALRLALSEATSGAE